MEIDVGAYIADLLFEHENVNIPGLGGFTTSYKPAQIDQVQGILSPPSKNIEFNENLGVDDGLLLNYIMEKDRLSYEAAKLTVEDYVEQVNAAIQRKEIIVFPRIGRLYKDFEGKLQFLSDNTNFNQDAFGLPQVKFHPIVKKRTAAAASSPGKPSLITNLSAGPEVRNWWKRNLPYVVAAGMVVIIMGALGLAYNQFTRQERPDPMTNIPADRLNQKPPASRQEEDPILDFPVDDSLATLSDAPLDEFDETETESSTPAPDQKYCIIAVGMFRDRSNVENLVKRIFQEGFEPITNPRGDLTQVTIQITYEDQADIDRALKTIRQKFEPNAMVIKK